MLVPSWQHGRWFLTIQTIYGISLRPAPCQTENRDLMIPLQAEIPQFLGLCPTQKKNCYLLIIGSMFMRTFRQFIERSSQYKLNSEDPNSNCELSFWPIFESLAKLWQPWRVLVRNLAHLCQGVREKHFDYNDLQELEATWTILKTYDWDDR